MSGGNSPAAAEALRALRRELATAAEDKIAQIVAMVDALPTRGEADALIAPLRQRLARMRLPRPLSLGRLLFMPVQPALVDGPQWRRGAPTVPRTACQPLIALVRARLGDEAAGIDAALSGQYVANTELVLAVGRKLWPRAADLLRDAPPPPGWQAQTGLADTDFPSIARTVRLVLGLGAWMHDSAAGLPLRPDEVTVVVARLGEVIRDGGAAETVAAGLFVVMLAALGDADRRIDLIEASMEPAARPVVHRARMLAMNSSLDRLDTGASLTGSLVDAAGSVRRDARLLDLFTEQAGSNPARRARVQEVRRNLDTLCQARFQAALDADLALPQAAPGSHAVVGDSAVMELEEAARTLHRFEQSARRIGGREFYDHALQAVADQLARPDASALSGIDRVRLTELLLGADAAMQLLKQVG
jgi:hypothetical protein